MMKKKHAVVESKISDREKEIARETIRAMAGVGMSYNFYFKLGVARLYLGSIRGTKKCAIREALEQWPKYRKRMVIRPNRYSR